MSLQAGATAPDFDVTASDGRRLRLADWKGKKNVVLYFYPKDFTPVCTAEACGFRDNYAALQSLDTEVIGVSLDGGESHQKFAQKHAVPFALVSDPERQLAKAYGAFEGIRAFFGSTKRITFVIDKQGQIAATFDSQLFAGDHVQGARKAIQKLEGREVA
jgi:thioredoxin-dependent peroxiredoxin